jgi:hypothetical protein
MLVLQVVPTHGVNAYKALRARIRDASTWVWGNKARTRLKHIQRPKGGHIRISDAGGVLVAHIHPATPRDEFYLTEKFMGRLIAWFENDLLSINVQFVAEPEKPLRKTARRKAPKRKAGRRKQGKRKAAKRKTAKRKTARRKASRRKTPRRRPTKPKKRRR